MQQTSLKRKENIAITLLFVLIISTISLSAVSIVASAETPSSYVYTNQWGTQNLNRPVCIAIDNNGDLYITDEMDRIQKFSSTGTQLGGWGNSGEGDGQFDTPKGIAIDATGNIYVVDSYNQRVQKFSANGDFITKWGSRGTDYRQFAYPTGIAIDSHGNVYVADTDNDRIQKFTSDGNFVTAWGSEGKGYGQFDSPTGLAIDKNDNVYVDDTFNGRIQKFTSDGTYQSSWGDFFYSQWIAVDKTNNVFVTDSNSVSKFNSEGTLITKWGNYGSGDGQFSSPTDLAISNSGLVYVLDSWNNRVEVFSPIGITDGNGDGSPVIGSFEGIVYLITGPAIVVICVLVTYFVVVKSKLKLTFSKRWRSSKRLMVIGGISCFVLTLILANFSVITWILAGILAAAAISIPMLIFRLIESEEKEKKTS